MTKRIYHNGNGIPGEKKSYKLCATNEGIEIMSKSQIVATLLYEQLSTSITNERELIQEVNDFIVKKTEAKDTISVISYDFRNDKEFQKLLQVLAHNRVSKHQCC